MNRAQSLLFETAAVLKAKPAELREKAEQNMAELRRCATPSRSSRQGGAGETERFLMGGHDLGELKVLTATLPNADAAKLRQMGDMLRDKQPNVVAVLSAVNDGKITFLAVCGKEAVSKGVKLVTSSRMSPPSAAARAAASRTAPWAEEMICSSWTTRWLSRRTWSREAGAVSRRRQVWAPVPTAWRRCLPPHR